MRIVKARIEGGAGTYFVVGFPSARSIAQEMVPLWSHPYASTPTVLPAHSQMWQFLWIDLRSGSSPSDGVSTVSEGEGRESYRPVMPICKVAACKAGRAEARGELVGEGDAPSPFTCKSEAMTFFLNF